MRFLSAAEGAEWLQGQTAEVLGTREVFLSSIPDNSGRRTALARLLRSFLEAAPSGGALHVTGFGIWGSSENRELYQVVRAAFGDTRLLHEAPWHLFDATDLQRAECILDLALYFYWDATLYLPAHGCAILFDHDDGLSVQTTGGPPEAIVSALREFGLKEYVRTK